jgi:hypothetical protein
MATDPDRIESGVAALIARFAGTVSMIEHLRIVDEDRVREQFAWLRKNRKDAWDRLRPVILDSWHRVYPQVEHRAIAKRHAEDIEAARQRRGSEVQRARG